MWLEGRALHGTGGSDGAIDRIELATPMVECGNNALEKGSLITGVSAAGSGPNAVVGSALVASAGIVPPGGVSARDVVLGGVIDVSDGGSDDKLEVLSRNAPDVIPGTDAVDADMVGAGMADEDTAGDGGCVAPGSDVLPGSVPLDSISVGN